MRFARRIVSLLALVVGVPDPAAAQEALAAPFLEDDALIVRTVVSGLTSPTTLAFLAEDEFLVLEKDTGKVRHVRNGSIVGTAIDLAVNFAGERGALGIATHPGFADNGFVYLFWTWKGSGGGPDGLLGADSDDLFEVPTRGNRVDRFVWNGSRLRFDRNILLAPARVVQSVTGELLTDHQGGVLAFGPDRELYVVLGDQHLRGKLQNIEAGPHASDQNFTGVIVRVNADGSAPPDNPFFERGRILGGEVGRNLQRIFAYGIRNSFGVDFDPLTSELWMQENGDDTLDELQRVPAGLNSRWIQIMGPKDRYEHYRSTEIASVEALDNPAFPPERLAPTAAQALNRLFELPGAIARAPDLSWKFPLGLAGIGFVKGAGLGPEYVGDLFVGDAVTGRLFRFQLSDDRSTLVFRDARLGDGVADNTLNDLLRESETLTAGRGFGVVTDIESGPDGRLYVVSLSEGKVFRISRR